MTQAALFTVRDDSFDDKFVVFDGDPGYVKVPRIDVECLLCCKLPIGARWSGQLTFTPAKADKGEQP